MQSLHFVCISDYEDISVLCSLKGAQCSEKFINLEIEYEQIAQIICEANYFYVKVIGSLISI